MSPRTPPSPDTLLALVRLARRVLDAWPQDRPVPKEVERARRTFYDLTDYHSIAPAGAPHIVDDGLI